MMKMDAHWAARETAKRDWLAENGMYAHEEEHSSCGVGLVVSIDGTPSRDVVQAGIEALAYLEGSSLGSLLAAEKRATEYALVASERPNFTIRFPRIDAHHVGAFIQLWQVATAYAGRMLGVDAYNQPAVELGKQATFGLMGKPGFEQHLRDVATLVVAYFVGQHGLQLALAKLLDQRVIQHDSTEAPEAGKEGIGVGGALAAVHDMDGLSTEAGAFTQGQQALAQLTLRQRFELVK